MSPDQKPRASGWGTAPRIRIIEPGGPEAGPPPPAESVREQARRIAERRRQRSTWDDLAPPLWLALMSSCGGLLLGYVIAKVFG